MPSALVHGFETPWTSTDPTLVRTTVVSPAAQGAGSMRLVALSGAAGVKATFTPAAPLDLSAHDELRLWVHADRVADGGARRPYLVELGYRDSGDAAGEEHRWLIPVNRARTWEQHRFGIGSDRRTSVTELWFGCLTDAPLRLDVDELLSVAEESLSDVEQALSRLLEEIRLPGVDGMPVQNAPAGANSIKVPLTRRLYVGNRLRVSGMAPLFEVTDVTHHEPTQLSTLRITPVLPSAASGGATARVTAPVVIEEPPFSAPGAPADLPDPVVLLSLTDQREEPERAWNILQRDSFRRRGPLVVCSVRPPARPILAEYQVLCAATDRRHSLALREAVLRRIGVDTGLRVNGTVLPVRPVLPPALGSRERATAAPIYVHVSTRVETGVRTEYTGVRHGTVLGGPLDAPFGPGGVPSVPGTDDLEGIRLRFGSVPP